MPAIPVAFVFISDIKLHFCRIANVQAANALAFLAIWFARALVVRIPADPAWAVSVIILKPPLKGFEEIGVWILNKTGSYH